ncbi:S9 family peptidase [Niabella drilacis]|uniref:Dipeptidyl aminopeptidase/acylaminoacyl peptidase n=1 Tax=Niabella drilacis (strain DSM 25811 / CCM 8410 / CCUG 62505 / LMG 26954 / E90) TaxID=1285928 RepID=A0A1G6Z8Y8_NIADE|nr:S9 family peptidase [Niabella drilacis]SDD99149.1 Dipeptidyl aminopeptidase/acylaminoacyl peptidase [Niabella drilacis]
MRKLFILLSAFSMLKTNAQQHLTPETLLKLGRVSAIGISNDQQSLIYKVSTPNIAENKMDTKEYAIPLSGGAAAGLTNATDLVKNNRIAPNGQYILSSDEVLLEKVLGKDLYPELDKTSAQVYTALNYRHWDKWFDGRFSHVFFAPYVNGQAGEKKDIMPGEPYFCPQQPFGGDEDFIWSPDSKKIVYVTKKKFGTDYAVSTNTDIYEYDIATGTTKNLTGSNKGYDVAPAFSKQGKMAWLQMKTAGYEADKNDLVVMTNGTTVNLTGHNDQINVSSFTWSNDGKSLFFIAPINGTEQVFSVNDIGLTRMLPRIRQLSKGDFDITSIIAQTGEELIVARETISRASEIYKLNIKTGLLTQLTHVNDAAYENIAPVKTERRWVTTADNKKMMEWIVYPPDFDPSKKYPTLLYCQGGPQSATTQFYSYRWNFHLMASQGYIVVIPSRRGMPGFGTRWNAEVSKDWGGKVLQDYLDAIDDISKEPFVDKDRRAAVGASFGGYSVFALAGCHQKRFKTFIAHDGVFDFTAMTGTTDELWFEQWEKGGYYWEKNNKAAQRSYAASPLNFVANWDTPILIVQGGKDYRVPIEQGQGAFQAAQLRGIKSKFLFFPDENHWVLKPQNATVWQREFFGWLRETL